MKTIMCHISLLLLGMNAVAQGPFASQQPNLHTVETQAEADVPQVLITRLSEPDYFPEAAEYAFSVQADPQTAQVLVQVNAAPAPARARITDENGNLLYFAASMEIDHGYLFPSLPKGSYLLRLDTEEGLPAGSYRLICE